MAWKNYGDASDIDTEMVWDLRRVFAEKILGITLQKIQFARASENYPAWFHLLKRDLKTEIFKNLESKERNQIEEQISKTKAILYKFGNAYIGKNKNPEEHEAVEETLCDLEILMTTLMQQNGLFGAREQDEGLF